MWSLDNWVVKWILQGDGLGQVLFTHAWSAWHHVPPPPFLYGCKLLLIISLDIYKALCFIFTTASGCLQSPARLSFKVFQTNADTACLPMEDAEFNHLHARQSRDGFLLRQYFGATSKGTKDGILRSDSRAE